MAPLEITSDFDVDRVSRTFAGKKVLISGVTGFIGQVLIEKLLRVCFEVDEIILIVRTKRGKDPKQRIADMFSNILFKTLLSKHTLEDVLSKITTVSGEMMEKNLGLSEKDREICKQVDIIIHGAATVRFDEDLKSVVMKNCGGTRSMLELATQCPNLQLMIHISTAYCHLKEKVLEEQFYPPPKNPKAVFALIELMDDETIKEITPKLLGIYPNTYGFSKAISEALVEEYSKTIPVVIVRPSIVIPLAKDPLTGWTNNLNGPMGLLIGAGKGVIRTMYQKQDEFVDLIPADYVINGILVVAWDYIENGYAHNVLNFVSSDELSITWQQMTDIGRESIENQVPFDNLLWYPNGDFTSFLWLHYIRFVLYQFIPAIFVDILLFCLGYKPFLIQIQKRIWKQYNVLEYYTNNHWFFKNDKTKLLRTKLNAVEQDLYPLDTSAIDLREYIRKSILTTRRVLLNEQDENIPRAKRNFKIIKTVDRLIKGIFYITLLYFVSKTIYSYIIY